MAQYQCESCNEPRDAPICPKCGADTKLRGDLPNASLEQLVERVSRNAAAAEAAPAQPPRGDDTRSRPSAIRPELVSVDSPRVAGADPVAPAAPAGIVGLDEFHALLDRGTKAVILCGASYSGKSEIASGYIRANSAYRGRAQNLTLRASLRSDYVLGATNPGEVWFQVIDNKRAFLDPSGEFYKWLSREERQRLGLTDDVTEANFQFVQRAVSALAGIIVVVDLTSTVDRRQQQPWRRQEEDLKFVLSALRWLRWDKEARPEAIGVSTNIAQRVSTLPRIDKRVLVLFSKADQLARLTNQTPLELARKRLPTLHGALMTHASRFRYDFCNTMVKTAQGDQAVDPCGVLLPMDWLLDDPLRWLPLQLPTSWIGGGR